MDRRVPLMTSDLWDEEAREPKKNAFCPKKKLALEQCIFAVDHAVQDGTGLMARTCIIGCC
jgi:hypothetical protein